MMYDTSCSIKMKSLPNNFNKDVLEKSEFQFDTKKEINKKVI